MVTPANPPLCSQVQIRQATHADLPALEWDGEFSHFRRLYADAYRAAENGNGLIWVAIFPGLGVIGQVFVSLRGSRPDLADGVTRAYIYGFRVRPAHRNQGLGARMMLVVEADLRQRGYRLMTLNVARQNLAARRFYERLGYRVVAADPGRWSYVDHEGHRRNVFEPAWRMEKLIARP